MRAITMDWNLANALCSAVSNTCILSEVKKFREQCTLPVNETHIQWRTCPGHTCSECMLVCPNRGPLPFDLHTGLSDGGEIHD